VIERSRVRLLAGALPDSLGQLSLPSLRGIGKSSTGLLAGVKAGRVHLCRVALCDPIWQVTLCSSRRSFRRGLHSVLTRSGNQSHKPTPDFCAKIGLNRNMTETIVIIYRHRLNRLDKDCIIDRRQNVSLFCSHDCAFHALAC